MRQSLNVIQYGIVGQFEPIMASEPSTLFLIFKAFAAVCSAMTGIEAISDGVPAFKKPEPRNARITLTWMAAILATLFLGIMLLAVSYHAEADERGSLTVIVQLVAASIGGEKRKIFRSRAYQA